MEKLVPAEHFEPDPEEGWKGGDLEDDEITDDSELAGLHVAHWKGDPVDGLGEPDKS